MAIMVDNEELRRKKNELMWRQKFFFSKAIFAFWNQSRVLSVSESRFPSTFARASIAFEEVSENDEKGGQRCDLMIMDK
jgi:hypothetical protein